MHIDRKRTKPERKLSSLVRERQRLMQMTLQHEGPMQIMVSVGDMRTVLRKELCIIYGFTTSGLLRAYLHILDEEIKQLTTEVVAQARAERRQQQDQQTDKL